MSWHNNVNALGAVLVCVGFGAGCGGSADARSEGRAEQQRELLPDVRVTYEANVPEAFRVRIAQTKAADSQRTVVAFDARENRRFFPMPGARLRFRDKHELLTHLAKRLGAVEEIRDGAGALDGLRSTYRVDGELLFEDREQGLRYQVREPVLALFGGAHGLVEIGGELTCVDPDGACAEGEYASYLEPVGVPTAPTHVTRCDAAGRVCVQFHSFFNQTWFPFPYARHGSNVSFTRNSAISSTRLTTGGFFQASGVTLALPPVTSVGQNSVETSVTCVGSTSCPAYNAAAVCGTGSITDPDVRVSNVRTGNGPLNNAVCPG